MSRWIDDISSWLDARIGISPELQEKLVGTLLVVLAYAVATRLSRRIAARLSEDRERRYSIKKATDYLFGFVGFGIILRIWVQGVTGFATYLGLLSAGIAVALQDPLINLAGWLFIVARSPFDVGDRIQIGQHAGDVVDVRIFQFTLLEIGNWVHADQSTGRVIHVPNGWVFKQSVLNYDKGFRYIWNEIPVLITFESNWRRAKQVLLQCVTEHAEHLTGDAEKQINEAAERYHLKFTKLSPVVWLSAVDSGVRLTLRYLCKPRDRRTSEDEMWTSILEAVGALDDVELAYPTVRYFDNAAEGKPEAKSLSMLPPAPRPAP